jgi:hypothetical protein
MSLTSRSNNDSKAQAPLMEESSPEKDHTIARASHEAGPISADSLESLEYKESVTASTPLMTTIRGVLCVLGGALFNVQMGILYCWGNFITYSPPAMRFYDGVYRHKVPPDSLLVIVSDTVHCIYTSISNCLPYYYS